MKKDEAITLYSGKYAVLQTASWGSYLCGPLTVHTFYRKPWRLSGSILRCVAIPFDGKPPMVEGHILEVGSCNAGEEVFDTIPEKYGDSYKDSLVRRLEERASLILNLHQELREKLQAAKEDPTSMEIIPTTFRNIRGTRMRLAVRSIAEKLVFIATLHREYEGTMKALRHQKRIAKDPMPFEIKLEETREARKKWVDDLSNVDLGPTEYV